MAGGWRRVDTGEVGTAPVTRKEAESSTSFRDGWPNLLSCRVINAINSGYGVYSEILTSAKRWFMVLTMGFCEIVKVLRPCMGMVIRFKCHSSESKFKYLTVIK